MESPGSSGIEVLDGLWRFTAIHPEWEDDNDGWEPEVNWWAVRTREGMVLIDPLVVDWEAVDQLVDGCGGRAVIVRTTYWHERTIPAARERYGAEVWARLPSAGAPPRPLDPRPLDRDREAGAGLPGGLEAIDVIRDDEIGLWLPDQAALVFGDVMIRDRAGVLAMCPESWIERAGGHAALRRALAPLAERDIQHVLVSHGPLVLGDGAPAFARAIAG